MTEQIAQAPDMSRDPSRRGFLHMLAGVPVGAAVAAAMLPVEYAVAGAMEHQGIEVGNASVKVQIDEACGDSGDPTCISKAEDSALPAFSADMGAPIVEETVFRAIPAWLSDAIEVGGGDLAARPRELATRQLYGSGQPLTSRRELVTGAVSSLAFALSHNVTNRGVNTKIAPVPQLLAGLVLWVLQRKAGVLSNVTAHATTNAVVRKMHP